VSSLSSISAEADQITTVRQPTDDAARCSTSSSTAANKTNESIIVLLEPHTSSPDLRTIARILTDLLLAGIFGYDGLFDILNAELDILAISPQAKQSIIPALVGIHGRSTAARVSQYCACTATCMPLLIVFISIVAHPCISHEFNLSQHRRALMVECLSTLTQIPWAPRFIMRLTSADSLPTLEVARLLGTLPSLIQTFYPLLLFPKPRWGIFTCTLTALRARINTGCLASITSGRTFRKVRNTH
jgi:hypothetical protein